MIANTNKYIIGKRSNNNVYYSVLKYNNINMLVLFLGLTFLYKYSNSIHAFEEYKKKILKKNGYLLAQDPGENQYSTQTEIDSEMFDIVILSQYTAEDDNIPYLLEAFPEYTKEELKQHEYRMSVDNYLEVLEKFLKFYVESVPYIILYEDDTRKIHCEEYHPTEEEKASNWKAIPNNHAK